MTEKKLTYAVEGGVDNQLLKGIRDLRAGVKSLDDTFKNVGKAVSVSVSQIKSETKSAQQPVGQMTRAIEAGFKSIAKEIHGMLVEFRGIRNEVKNSLGYVQTESTKTGRAINRIAQESVKTGQAVRENLGKSAEAMKSFADSSQKSATAAQRASAEVSKLAASTKETGKAAEDSGRKLEGMAQSVSVLSGAITAGMALAMRDSLSTFMDVERELLKFNAVSQASTEEAAAFRAEVDRLNSSTAYNGQQLSSAGVALAKMGFSAKETTQALKGMVNASLASGESLEETSSIIASTMRQFGLAASKAGEVGDLITLAANKSAIDIRDWGESMRYLGSAAAASGQPLTDMAALLVELGNSGIKATVAGNGLQNSILRLQAPTAAGKAIMEKYNIAVKDLTTGGMRPLIDIIGDLQTAFKDMDKVDQAANLKELFGEVALNSMQVFFNKTKEEIEETREGMKKFQGTAGDTADKMQQGLTKAMTEMQSAVSGLKTEIGQQLAPEMIKLANFAKDTANEFREMSQWKKDLIKQGALLTLGLGAITSALALGALGVLKFIGLSKTMYAALTTSTTITALKTAAIYRYRDAIAMATMAQHGHTTAVGRGAMAATGFIAAWSPAIVKFGLIAAAIYAVVKALQAVHNELEGLNKIADNLDAINAETAKQLELRRTSQGSLKKVQDLTGKGQAEKLTAEDYNRAAYALTIQAGRSSGNPERDKLLEQAKAYRELAKAASEAADAEKNRTVVVEDAGEKFKKQLKAVEDKQSADLKQIEIDKIKRLNQLKSSDVSDSVANGAGKMAAALDESTRSIAENANTVGNCYARYGDALKKAEQVAGILDQNGRVLKQGQSIWADIRDNERASAYMFNAAAARAVKRGLLEEYRPKSFADITAGTTMVLPAGWHAKNKDGHIARVDAQGYDYSDHKDSILRRNPQLMSNPNVKFYRYTGSAGGDEAQADKQREKIEQEALQRQLAIYQRDKAAYEQLLKSKTAADEGYADAQSKILDLQTKIAETEGKLLDLGVDAAKQRKKAAEEALKETQRILEEQLKSIEQPFSEIEQKIKGLVKSAKEQLAALQEKELLATMTPAEQEVYAIEKAVGQEFVNQVNEATKRLADIRMEMNAIKQAGALMTADQKNKVAELEGQYKSLLETIKEVHGEDGIGAQLRNKLITQLAQADFDKWSEERKKVDDFILSLKNSDEAMDEFRASIFEGETDLLDLQKQMKMTNGEFDELINLLGQRDALEEWNAEIEHAREVKALATVQTNELSDAVKDKLVEAFEGALQVVGNIIYQFERAGSEFAGLAGTFLDGASSMGDAIKKLFVSGGTDVGAWVQLVSTGLNTVISLFNQVNESALRAGHNIRTSILGVNQSRQELNILGLRQQHAQALKQGNTELANKIQLEIEFKVERAALDNVIAQFQNEASFSVGNRASLALAQGLENNWDFSGVAEQLSQALEAGDWSSPIVKSIVENMKADSPFLSHNEIASQLHTALEMLSRYAVRAGEVRLQTEENLDRISEAEKELLASTQDVTNKLAEEYFARQNQQQYFAENVEKMLSQMAGSDEQIRDEMRPLVESLLNERGKIVAEMYEAFGQNAMGGFLDPRGAIELQRRLAEFGEKASKALADGMEKALSNARKRFEQDLAEAERKLKGQSDALNKALEQRFASTSKHLVDAIALEQKRLDKINEQTKAIQRQIQLREDDRRSQLEQFDGEDVGIFAGLVRNVDYDAAVRQGLEDIHNPDGVLTETYSGKSIEEAIKERIELMEMENENRYKLEQITRDAYLKNQQLIAALQARAADEALQAEELTNRQRLELERQKADAYVKFQTAYREAINSRVDNEILALQRSVDANNRQAEVIQDNLDQHNRDLQALRDTYEKDTQLINTSIQAVLDKNTEWVFSVEELENGIQGPLDRIIEKYQQASAAAKQAMNSYVSGYSSSGGGSSGGSSGWVSTPGLITADTSGKGSAPAQITSQRATIPGSGGYSPYAATPKFASGGVVPDGYPNDTYLARLTSKEPVFPAWFSDLLERTHRSTAWASSGGSIQNSSRVINVGGIHLNGVYNDSGAVKKEVVEAMREIELGDGSNRSYVMFPGMI